MMPFEAKRLIGRKIVKVDMGGHWDADLYGGSRRYMHDPTIALDDGTELRFVVEESPSGDHYGVNIVQTKRRGAGP